jgi:hypothetical protein
MLCSLANGLRLATRNGACAVADGLIEMRALKSLRIGTGLVIRGTRFRVLPEVALQMLLQGAAVLLDEDDLDALRVSKLADSPSPSRSVH